MHGKKLMIAIVAVTLFFIGNILYFQSHQLKEPVILPHYVDLQLNQDGYGMMDLYYVTNQEQEIWNVIIPGIEYVKVEFETVHQNLPHYFLKKASLQLQAQNITEELIISDVEVQFSGSNLAQLYQIGEIRIRPSTNSEKEHNVRMLASGSSNNQMSFFLFEMMEPLQLVNVNFPFQGMLKDNFRMFFDFDSEDLTELHEKGRILKDDHDFVHERLWEKSGVEYPNIPFPVPFEANDVLLINHEFLFPNDSDLGKAIFNFELEFLFEDEKGEEVTAKSYIDYLPYFTNREIKDFIEKVGGRGE